MSWAFQPLLPASQLLGSPPPVKLYLRNTTANGISIGGVACYDWLDTPGSAGDTAVVNATASGSNILFTKTAGGSVVRFITKRIAAGGWVITGQQILLWMQESALTVNAGARVRLYKWSAGTTTELTGSPTDKGIELSDVNALQQWASLITGTLAEDDRLVLEVLINNVGTMAAGTATLNFNGDTTTVSSPAATYIGEATLNFSGSTSTATAANIGAANANRRVVAACQQGTAAGRTLTSATIGGISARIEHQCTDSGSNAGAYIISAVVPTGTTADIVLTFSSTIFADGTAHVYTVDDTTISSTVNGGTNTTAGATSIAVGYTATNGGVTIGVTDWNNGTGKTPVTVTGYTTDMADSDWVAFRRTESASGSQTATTAWSGSFGAASAVVSYAPVSTTTYGNSYINVYPLVTFKAEGGGAVNADITESLASSESSSALAVFSASTTESITTSETEGAIASFGVSASESVAASELASVSVNTFVEITEAATASETLSAGLLSTGDVTEPATASEAQSATVTHAASIAETVTAAEAQSAQANFIADTTESVSTDSSQSSTIITEALITEPITATETSNFGSASSSADITESISIVADQSAISQLQSAITETITAGESSSSQAVFTPSITETLTMSVIESANYSTPATITESSSADSSQDSSFGSTNLYSDIEEIFASDELSVATYQTNSNIIESTSVIDASFTDNIIVADVTESVNLTDTYSVIVKLVKRAVSSVLAIRDLGTGLVKRVLSSNLTERDVDSNLTKRDVDSNLDEREP